MNHSTSALFTLLCLIQVLGRSCSDQTDQRQVLAILNLVSETTVASGAAYAARLAVAQINNRSDLLQGYRVELVEATSDECGVDTASAAGLGYEEGLVSFVKNAVHSTDLNVVGVVGLLCSAVTDGLSPVIGRKGSDLIQISGSTSPILRDSIHPRLYRVVSSSAIYADLVVELMKQVGWTRISEVHDFHHIATTEVLINKVSKGGLQIPYTSLYFPGHQSIECILQDFSVTGSTILYVSFSQSRDIAELLCSAYASKMTWPRYLYFVPDRTPSDVLDSISMTGDQICNRSLLVKAMEGVVFLNYDLEQSADVILVSGDSYQDYRMRLGLTGQALWHGNVIFDEVWSLALALNKTSSGNISLANYQAKNGAIADEVEEALGKIAFQGATGIIQFNTDKEVVNAINIHDSNGRLLVQYDKDGHLSLLIHEIFPSDFDQEVQVIDSWVSMVTFIACGLSYGLTTLNLIILIYYKKEKELKATSPYLSLIMFFACYILYTAALFRNINKAFVLESDTLFVTLCTAEIWMGSLGFTMIFSTLFTLHLRILYLFNYFGKTGKYWADKYLVFTILLMTSVSVVILSVWTGIYRPEKVTIELVPPEKVITFQCDGKYLGFWLAGLFTYGGIIMMFVSIFACANRKIKRSEFKDTKKVNFYIYLIFIIITIVMPTWYLLRVSKLFTLAHFALCTGFISVGIICQLILYVPKTLPVWWRNLTGQSSTTQKFSTTDNQYSKVWA